MAGIALICRDVRGSTGTTRTIIEHSRHLKALGWSVDVLGDRLDAAALSAAGANPRQFWRPPFLRRQLFAWRADRAARAYDLVHGHGDHTLQDILSLHNCVHAAHEAVHGTPHPGGGVAALHARLLKGRAFKLLICNSKLMQEDVVARFGVPKSMTKVIYPGHDTKRFKPGRRDDVRASLGVTSKDFLVGLITSGDFKKRGVEIFRAAMAALPNLKSVVIGKGPGAIAPVPDVEKYYQALDLYVHPAHFEEFGQSVQEALACGVPVLAGKRVGAAELMGPEHRALLLDRIDAGALADAIRAVADDEALRLRLKKEGPASVAGNDWDANFRATLSCYQAALKK
jgi:UDP-glucose:(heptosyl)LPS alpha-1,3-glucosyltransferase